MMLIRGVAACAERLNGSEAGSALPLTHSETCVHRHSLLPTPPLLGILLLHLLRYYGKEVDFNRCGLSVLHG
jgi:hypothetical protein